jgi:anti-repressor protein
MPQTQIDHQMTLDMAKQICMIQRSDLGRQYREYFLEIERKWNDPVTSMARSLVYANRQLASVTGQLEAANKKIEKLEPKAAYFDTVASADGSTSFRETAKLFKVGEKTFTKFIEESNFCYRDSHKRLIPYAERQKSGWFEVKEVTITTSTGIKTTIYTKITPKGRTEIFKRLQTAGILNPHETEGTV